MKKIFIPLLIVLLLLCGCTKKEEIKDNVESKNEQCSADENVENKSVVDKDALNKYKLSFIAEPAGDGRYEKESEAQYKDDFISLTFYLKDEVVAKSYAKKVVSELFEKNYIVYEYTDANKFNKEKTPKVNKLTANQIIDYDEYYENNYNYKNLNASTGFIYEKENERYLLLFNFVKNKNYEIATLKVTEFKG